MERLQKYESLLKLAEQRPQLEQKWPEKANLRRSSAKHQKSSSTRGRNSRTTIQAPWQRQYQREKIEVSEGTGGCSGPKEGEQSLMATAKRAQ